MTPWINIWTSVDTAGDGGKENNTLWDWEIVCKLPRQTLWNRGEFRSLELLWLCAIGEREWEKIFKLLYGVRSSQKIYSFSCSLVQDSTHRLFYFSTFARAFRATSSLPLLFLSSFSCTSRTLKAFVEAQNNQPNRIDEEARDLGEHSFTSSHSTKSFVFIHPSSIFSTYSLLCWSR